MPKDTEKKYDIACRPDEIEFVPTRAGAVIGTVARKTYLGTLIDYRIKIGNTEIRVQKTPPSRDCKKENTARSALLVCIGTSGGTRTLGRFRGDGGISSRRY